MRTTLAACAVGAAVAFSPAGFAQARTLHHHHHYRHVARADGFVPAYAPGYVYPPPGYGTFGPRGDGNPSDEPLGSGLHDPYLGYYGPGSIVLNRTEEARREPGATLELAPDAKETATGGPVGGVPGFDGN